MSCPDDVSVTGYNNLSFVSRVSPPLTTVGVPLNLMGELAADALLRWMSDPTGHTAVQTLLPVDFVQRATTATVALAARTAG